MLDAVVDDVDEADDADAEEALAFFLRGAALTARFTGALLDVAVDVDKADADADELAFGIVARKICQGKTLEVKKFTSIFH